MTSMFCFAEISTDVSVLLASLILINTKPVSSTAK